MSENQSTVSPSPSSSSSSSSSPPALVALFSPSVSAGSPSPPAPLLHNMQAQTHEQGGNIQPGSQPHSLVSKETSSRVSASESLSSPASSSGLGGGAAAASRVAAAVASASGPSAAERRNTATHTKTEVTTRTKENKDSSASVRSGSESGLGSIPLRRLSSVASPALPLAAAAAAPASAAAAAGSTGPAPFGDSVPFVNSLVAEKEAAGKSKEAAGKRSSGGSSNLLSSPSATVASSAAPPVPLPAVSLVSDDPSSPLYALECVLLSSFNQPVSEAALTTRAKMDHPDVYARFLSQPDLLRRRQQEHWTETQLAKEWRRYMLACVLEPAAKQELNRKLRVQKHQQILVSGQTLKLTTIDEVDGKSFAPPMAVLANMTAGEEKSNRAMSQRSGAKTSATSSSATLPAAALGPVPPLSTPLSSSSTTISIPSSSSSSPSIPSASTSSSSMTTSAVPPSKTAFPQPTAATHSVREKPRPAPLAQSLPEAEAAVALAQVLSSPVSSPPSSLPSLSRKSSASRAAIDVVDMTLSEEESSSYSYPRHTPPSSSAPDPIEGTRTEVTEDNVEGFLQGIHSARKHELTWRKEEEGSGKKESKMKGGEKEKEKEKKTEMKTHPPLSKTSFLPSSSTSSSAPTASTSSSAPKSSPLPAPSASSSSSHKKPSSSKSAALPSPSTSLAPSCTVAAPIAIDLSGSPTSSPAPSPSPTSSSASYPLSFPPSSSSASYVGPKYGSGWDYEGFYSRWSESLGSDMLICSLLLSVGSWFSFDAHIVGKAPTGAAHSSDAAINSLGPSVPPLPEGAYSRMVENGLFWRLNTEEAARMALGPDDLKYRWAEALRKARSSVLTKTADQRRLHTLPLRGAMGVCVQSSRVLPSGFALGNKGGHWLRFVPYAGEGQCKCMHLTTTHQFPSAALIKQESSLSESPEEAAKQIKEKMGSLHSIVYDALRQHYASGSHVPLPTLASLLVSTQAPALSALLPLVPRLVSEWELKPSYKAVGGSGKTQRKFSPFYMADMKEEEIQSAIKATPPAVASAASSTPGLPLSSVLVLLEYLLHDPSWHLYLLSLDVRIELLYAPPTVAVKSYGGISTASTVAGAETAVLQVAWMAVRELDRRAKMKHIVADAPLPTSLTQMHMSGEKSSSAAASKTSKTEEERKTMHTSTSSMTDATPSSSSSSTKKVPKAISSLLASKFPAPHKPKGTGSDTVAAACPPSIAPPQAEVVKAKAILTAGHAQPASSPSTANGVARASTPSSVTSSAPIRSTPPPAPVFLPPSPPLSPRKLAAQYQISLHTAHLPLSALDSRSSTPAPSATATPAPSSSSAPIGPPPLTISATLLPPTLVELFAPDSDSSASDSSDSDLDSDDSDDSHAHSRPLSSHAFVGRVRDRFLFEGYVPYVLDRWWTVEQLVNNVMKGNFEAVWKEARKLRKDKRDMEGTGEEEEVKMKTVEEQSRKSRRSTDPPEQPPSVSSDLSSEILFMERGLSQLFSDPPPRSGAYARFQMRKHMWKVFRQPFLVDSQQQQQGQTNTKYKYKFVKLPAEKRLVYQKMQQKEMEQKKVTSRRESEAKRALVSAAVPSPPSPSSSSLKRRAWESTSPLTISSSSSVSSHAHSPKRRKLGPASLSLPSAHAGAALEEHKSAVNPSLAHALTQTGRETQMADISISSDSSEDSHDSVRRAGIATGILPASPSSLPLPLSPVLAPTPPASLSSLRARLSSLESARLCVSCRRHPKSVSLQPCGHLVWCGLCAKQSLSLAAATHIPTSRCMHIKRPQGKIGQCPVNYCRHDIQSIITVRWAEKEEEEEEEEGMETLSVSSPI